MNFRAGAWIPSGQQKLTRSEAVPSIDRNGNVTLRDDLLGNFTSAFPFLSDTQMLSENGCSKTPIPIDFLKKMIMCRVCLSKLPWQLHLQPAETVGFAQ